MYCPATSVYFLYWRVTMILAVPAVMWKFVNRRIPLALGLRKAGFKLLDVGEGIPIKLIKRIIRGMIFARIAVTAAGWVENN